MKEDVEIPAAPPRKRRALQTVPDVWLAVWAQDPALTPSEQRQVRAERERRKALRARESPAVTIVRAAEGATPAQRRAARERVPAGADVAVATAGEEGDREAIDAAVLVIACPREMTMPDNVPTWVRSPVWHAISYAKNRRIPVRIILPNGEEGHFA